MRVDFPYPGSYVDIPDENLLGVYAAPKVSLPVRVQEIVRQAMVRAAAWPVWPET